MADQEQSPPPPVAIPWYQSRILLGLIVSMVSKMLVISGVASSVSSDKQEFLVNSLVLMVGFAADGYAGWKRLNQEAAPNITGTQKAADVQQVAAANTAEREAEVPSWMRK
jgi:hypothetical protein